jgi:photosystem II stability/assembly factor-like uncharacterized protein
MGGIPQMTGNRKPHWLALVTFMLSAQALGAGLALCGDSAASRPSIAAWEPIGLSGGGAMFTPAISPVDPRLIMVNCDMSCVFISRDGGLSWQMIHHSQLRGNTRCRPCFHPTDPNVIYAAGGYPGNLRISRDQGRTWSPVGNIPGALEGEIAIDPDQPARMLAGANGRVWRSNDSGTTWGRVDGPQGKTLGFHFDRTSPADRRICFAATENGVWRSDDGTATWADVSAGLPWRGLRAFAGGSNRQSGTAILYCAIPSRSKTFSVGGQRSFQGGVYRSSDGGKTWGSAMGDGINKETQPTGQWADGPIAQYHHVLTTDVKPETVWAFNSSTGFPPPHHATAFRSDDAGRHWRATFYPDPRFPGFNVEHNYTTATLNQSFPSVPHGVAIAPGDPDRVLQVTGDVYLTTDGGKTWTNGHTCPVPSAPVPGGKAKPEEFLNTGLVVTSTWNYYVDPFQPKRHYICYTDIGFARSLDAARSWRWWRPEIPGSWKNTCYELAFDPEIPGKIWGAFSGAHDIPNGNVITGTHYARLAGGGAGGIGLSQDFAATWKPWNQGLPNAPACSVVLDPKSPKGRRTLYAAVFAHGVYKSIDDGRTWVDKSRSLGSDRNRRACRVSLHPDGTLFCLVTAMYRNGEFEPDGVGLYRSKDAAETWERVPQSPLLLWPKDFTVNPKDSKEIYVGACDVRTQRVPGPAQGGLWRTTDGGATWQRIGRQGSQHFGAYLHPSRPGWIYMTLCEGPPGPGLWLSKDNGSTWRPFDGLPFSNIQRVTFDPADKDLLYVTTFGGSVWKGPAEPGDAARG